MIITVSTEIDDIDNSTEAEGKVVSNPPRMSNHEIENSSSNCVTSEKVACQIKAVTDPLTQQLAQAFVS